MKCKVEKKKEEATNGMILNSTAKGSLLEVLSKGWDMAKIDECCSHAPEELQKNRIFGTMISIRYPAKL